MTDTERRKLAEAASPGPWKHATYLSGTQNVEFPGSRGVAIVDEVKDGFGDLIGSSWVSVPPKHFDVAHRQEDKGLQDDPRRTHNASHIAANDPQTIIADLDRIAALEARVAELEAALNPFAHEAKRYDGLDFDSERLRGGTNLTVGDLRRAAATLEKKP